MVQRILLIPMHGSAKERVAFMGLARKLHAENKLPGIPYEEKRVSIGTGPEDNGSIRLLGERYVAVIDVSKPKEVMRMQDNERAFVIFPTYQDKEPVVRNIAAAKRFIRRNNLDKGTYFP